jgi:predicted NBD/HSP70 family sugar kinase
MVQIDHRQRELLRLLWREGRLSRWELHERTGVNPNAVGVDVGALLSQNIVRELQSSPAGPGRPRVPLEIDPTVRHVIGLSLSPGRVEVGRLNLRGHLLGRSTATEVSDLDKLVPAAQAMLKDQLNDQTLAIGLSSTGLIDPESQMILGGTSIGAHGGVTLHPIYEVAGEMPMVVENDLHALAARWLLTHQADSDQDVLLVSVADGQLGAALLIDGRPNRGCAIGANELGHTRFFVETEPCYCGHPGCLERIVDTAFLRRLGVERGTLMERASAFNGDDAAMGQVLDYLSAGLANATNFARPNRLVIVSELVRYAEFNDALMRMIRGRLLPGLLPRVRIDLWDQPATQSAETAGWLALAGFYREGWNRG